jgi:hypothetical protein
LQDGEHRRRGEASSVYYLGYTAESIVAAIEARRSEIEAGIDRAWERSDREYVSTAAPSREGS